LERTHPERVFRILNAIDEFTGMVWQTGWNKTLIMQMFKNAWQNYFAFAEFPPISVQIMVLNSLPTSCVNGSAD
jgi:hypothetical protein